MSLKNIAFNQGTLTLEDFTARNNFKIMEDINSITHKIDESSGEYIIHNSDNNNILSVNKNGTLTNTSYIKSHIDNTVSPISSLLNVHTQKLDNIGTYNLITGATTNSNIRTIETIPIANNKIGMIEGYLMSSGCYIKFSTHVKNLAGTVSILSYNLDYENCSNNEEISFVNSSTNILIRFSNTTGTNNYNFKYITDFINL